MAILITKPPLSDDFMANEIFMEIKRLYLFHSLEKIKLEPMEKLLRITVNLAIHKYGAKDVFGLLDEYGVRYNWFSKHYLLLAQAFISHLKENDLYYLLEILK